MYGDVNDLQLVVCFAGNQFMVTDDLLKEFKVEYTPYTCVFAETLSPGILAKQIQTGSVMIGNMRISVEPDVYAAGR